MKTTFLKTLDSFFGIPAVRLLSSPKKKARKAPASILLIRPGGIGDAVLLIPVIDILKKRNPDATIDILAEKRNSAVFSLSSSVNRILFYDKLNQLLAAIREDYDLVIDTEQWHRLSAIVARLTDAPMLIGYATNERGKLFTHPIDYSHDDYEVSSFFNLLQPLAEEAPGDPQLPFLSVPSALSEKAKGLLSPLGNGKVVALFPGGSISERKWGSVKFHKAAKLLIPRGYGIVVVGGKEDVKAGEDISRGVPNSLDFCGKLSLPETAAVLQQSSLLITGDSGIMHIGYGLGINIVALFGSGREKKWAPRGKNCIVINKHLPCSPCTTFGYTPKCKINALCMGSITVEEVFKASMSLLGGPT